MRTLAIAALLFLPGCHSLAQYRTAEKVAAASTVEHDQYDGTTWIKAPLVWYDGWLNDCRLRTLISRNGQRTDQLYIIYEASDWSFFHSAFDLEGNSLTTLPIDKYVLGAYKVHEHVAVEFPADYLDGAATAGLDIKIQGRSGETVVKLPPHYVRGFLDRVRTGAD